jgi:hypothetical protein
MPRMEPQQKKKVVFKEEEKFECVEQLKDISEADGPLDPLGEP